MAEISRPWNGIVTGDSGPYSDDQWSDLYKTMTAPTIANQGIFLSQLNELDLTGLPVTPVNIDTGRALVNGIWYESDAAVSVAIPTPGANPRVDRLVLRADWALQTVRVFRIAGAEAAAPVPPAIVQVDGVTWDLPLWQVHVTVGGVISYFRDERTFIGQYEPGAISDDHVYIDDDFYWPDAVPAATIATTSFYPWRAFIAGNYIVTAMPAFGRGAFTLENTGAGAGDVSVQQPEHRPDLMNARLRIRSKAPNVAVSLDREIGWVSGTANPVPADGIWFRADGTGAANWFAVCRAGGVETAVDTGQAPDDVWRKFEIRVRAQQVVTFLIDDAVVATIQANIPAVSLILVMGIYDDGAAPVNNPYQQFDSLKLTGPRT